VSPPALFRDISGQSASSTIAERTAAVLAAKALHRGPGTWGNDIDLTASRGRMQRPQAQAEHMHGLPSSRGAELGSFGAAGSGRRHYHSPSGSPTAESRSMLRSGSGAETWRIQPAGAVDRSFVQADMVKEAKVQKSIAEISGKRGRTRSAGSRRLSGRTSLESPLCSPSLSPRGLNHSTSVDSSPTSRGRAGDSEASTRNAMSSATVTPTSLSQGLGLANTPTPRRGCPVPPSEVGLAAIARRARSQDAARRNEAQGILERGSKGAGKQSMAKSKAQPHSSPGTKCRSPRSSECKFLWRPGGMKSQTPTTGLETSAPPEGERTRLRHKAVAPWRSPEVQAQRMHSPHAVAPRAACGDRGCNTSIGSMVQEKLDMLFQELGQWQPDLTEDTKPFKGGCGSLTPIIDGVSTTATTATVTPNWSSCHSTPMLGVRSIRPESSTVAQGWPVLAASGAEMPQAGGGTAVAHAQGAPAMCQGLGHRQPQQTTGLCPGQPMPMSSIAFPYPVATGECPDPSRAAVRRVWK